MRREAGGKECEELSLRGKFLCFDIMSTCLNRRVQSLASDTTSRRPFSMLPVTIFTVTMNNCQQDAKSSYFLPF